MNDTLQFGGELLPEAEPDLASALLHGGEVPPRVRHPQLLQQARGRPRPRLQH